MQDPNLELRRERHGELSWEAERQRPARGLREAWTDRRSGERPGWLPEKEIEVRWELPDDKPRIGELLELNGMLRPLAFEERFIVAEKKGEVLAAVRYQTEPKQLMLGLLLTDPWAGERRLAAALYAGAGELARELGVEEVFAQPATFGDYPYEAGYRRVRGGWRLEITQPLYNRKELPADGWRRVLALWGVFVMPFFNLRTRS